MISPIFKNRTTKKAMERSKAEYLKAVSLSDDSRRVRAFKIRIGIRCRAHLDKVFIEGATKITHYQELCLNSVAQSKDKPEPPKPSPFQTAKTPNGQIYTYVPSEFAEKVFNLGGMYQNMTIDAHQAITLVQEVADQVSRSLGLENPFTTLQFLRDELAGKDTERDSDREDKTDNEDSHLFSNL